MKKTLSLAYSMILGSLIILSSCSNDDIPEKTTPSTSTATTNEASINGVTVTKTADPVMPDKIAVLETTAGKFETYFANKPTESGTYTVKSAFSSAKGLVDLKEVIIAYTEKTSQLTYTSNTSGTATITISGGKISIDIKNVDVCNGSACKKVSVKYDFAYTPPVKPVDPIDPNPVDPTPSAGTPGTGIINGVAGTDTKYKSTGTLTRNNVREQVVANMTLDNGTFQLRFKTKPTKAGTYKIGVDETPGGDPADDVVVFSYVPANIMDWGGYFSSTSESTGTVTVKIVGDKIIIEAVDIVAYKQ